MIVYLRALLLVLISLGVAPQAFSYLEEIQLPSLRDKATINTADLYGKVVLLSFFEPDCPWCYRQMKVFNQIQSECDERLQPLSVGIHGTDQKLRSELRRAKVQYPAVRGTPALIQLTGEINATPWTLVFGPKGKLLVTWRGYMKFAQVQALFPKLCPVTESTIG
jgi:thiol-disulfide isomerase/thioredoxin